MLQSTNQEPSKISTDLAFRIVPAASNLLASSLDVHSTVAQLLNPVNHGACDSEAKEAPQKIWDIDTPSK